VHALPPSPTSSNEHLRRVSSCEFEPSILLEHINEMTKALSELNQSKRDSLQQLSNSQFLEASFLENNDEPWMLPTDPARKKSTSSIKKDVTFVISTVDNEEKAKEAALDLEEEVEMLFPPSRNLLVKLVIVLGVNGLAAAAILASCLLLLS